MNDDLISRQDAIEAIKKSTKKYNYFMGMENYTEEDAIEAVMSVPTILSVLNTDKCTRINCPMQASAVPPDCNNPDCPFRTDMNFRTLMIINDNSDETMKEEIRKAAVGIYQVYTKLLDAGFNSNTAINIMIAMISVTKI